MKVSTKKKAAETLKYLEEIGMMMWELNETGDEKVKEIVQKMQLCYTVCAKNLKEMSNDDR